MLLGRRRRFEAQRRETARKTMANYEANYLDFTNIPLEELRSWISLLYRKGDKILTERKNRHLAEFDSMIAVGINLSKTELTKIEKRSKETALSDWAEWESTQTFGDPDLVEMKRQVGIQLEIKLYQHIVDLLTDKEKHVNRGELLRRVKTPIGVPELDERIKELTDEYTAEQEAIAERTRDWIRSQGGTLTSDDWGH
jgi:hypothetical protein